MTIIYFLTVYSNKGEIYDLGWSDNLDIVRKQKKSKETRKQIKELGIAQYKLRIRDNQVPTNYYD